MFHRYTSVTLFSKLEHGTKADITVFNTYSSIVPYIFNKSNIHKRVISHISIYVKASKKTSGTWNENSRNLEPQGISRVPGIGTKWGNHSPSGK